MNGHLPGLVTFPFNAEVPVGTQPVEPGGKNLLSVEDELPSWGRLVSFETNIHRDGQPVLDMHTYSFGVTKVGGKWIAKFQIWDVQVETIVDHNYRVEASIHYFPE